MNWIGLYTLVRKEFARIVRVAIQSMITPLVSALLYIFIFGYVIGRKIDLIGGVTYIDFVLPGILMMNVISASFSNTAFSLYFQRFTRSINEILASPLSHLEMIMGLVLGSLVRSVIVGMGIFVIAIL